MLGILECTRGLLSGSIALLMVSDLEFEPGDVDLYVPDSQEDTAIQLGIRELGFTQTESRDALYDNSSHIRTVHWLRKRHRKMNIMVVEGENAAIAIFRFHSTVVMNFLSSSGIYCAYPTLTLNNLAVPNSGLMICEVRTAQRCRQCFEKYRERGIRFETDPRSFPGHEIHTCSVDAECPFTVRSTEDGKGLFIELFEPTASEAEYIAEHTYCTIWALGGPICSGRRYHDGFSSSIRMETTTVC
ncbi:hypothetical protein C8F04DRAFT_964303 [Mycena alexandri]|uniref:Uncharacterized protein n=1 Tax=Mycena alexandri TaxID=1745969 RepID=A0AAD6SHS9_9AGAR|nr:hypothetical protein C8F04DRAFT_964303 [Mycena alexandri]